MSFQNEPRAYFSARISMAEDRKRPIRSGFRPRCWFGELDGDGGRLFYDAQFLVIDKDSVGPNEEAQVKVFPLLVEQWPEIYPEDEFEFYDNPTYPAGYGVIAEVYLHPKGASVIPRPLGSRVKSVISFP